MGLGFRVGGKYYGIFATWGGGEYQWGCESAVLPQKHDIWFLSLAACHESS